MSAGGAAGPPRRPAWAAFLAAMVAARSRACQSRASFQGFNLLIKGKIIILTPPMVWSRNQENAGRVHPSGCFQYL